jgi:hypothetical protein
MRDGVIIQKRKRRQTRKKKNCNLGTGKLRTGLYFLQLSPYFLRAQIDSLIYQLIKKSRKGSHPHYRKDISSALLSNTVYRAGSR